MTNYQDARLSAAKSVYGVMSHEDNVPRYADIPAISTCVLDLETKIALLETLVLTQSDPPSAASAAEKNQKLNVLAQNAGHITGALVSYANTIGDDKLAKKVSFPLSALTKLKDSKIVARCRSLHQTALPIVKALAACNITPAKLTALKQQTDEYRTLYTKPREAIAEGKAATKRLPVLLTETTRLLRKRLDPLMLQLKSSEPEFFQKYQAARRIVKPATNPEKNKKAKKTPAPQKAAADATPAKEKPATATKTA